MQCISLKPFEIMKTLISGRENALRGGNNGRFVHTALSGSQNYVDQRITLGSESQFLRQSVICAAEPARHAEI